MLKNFLVRKLIESKLKAVPEDQRNKIIELIEKRPDLFQKIALESQEKIKSGMKEMDAVMSVMKKYESELKDSLK